MVEISQSKNKIVIIFLFFQNLVSTCFGCSNDPSHQEDSFEHPQPLYYSEIKKSIYKYTVLSEDRRLESNDSVCGLKYQKIQ